MEKQGWVWITWARRDLSPPRACLYTDHSQCSGVLSTWLSGGVVSVKVMNVMELHSCNYMGVDKSVETVDRVEQSR